MPSWAARAPATRTAATPAPSQRPPEAISGSAVTRVTSRSRVSSPTSPTPSASLKVPRWAPASTPWTTSPPAPAAAARSASWGSVTVTQTSTPASPSRSITSGGGQPKANDATAGRSATSTASFSSQASSLHAASPVGAP